MARHFLTCSARAGYLPNKMAPETHLPEMAHLERKQTDTTAPESATDPHSGPQLYEYYRRLFAAYGPQHWWPGRTRFEVILGAILTQNTAWVNVERALANLRRAGHLAPEAVEAISLAQLARHIRPAGYFRQKAKTLKAVLEFLRKEYGGSLTRMFRASTSTLREHLLSVRGIGPETADSILLYAGKHAVFVVDAYTRRMLERHGLATPKDSYLQIQQFLEQRLPRDVSLYNEFHALIVRTGKEYCRKRDARCSECPLKELLPLATQKPA